MLTKLNRSQTWGLALLFLIAGLAPRASEARTLVANGTLKPLSTLALGTQISGAVQSITCAVNAAVKRGQTCAIIDPRPYERAVEVANANFATAKAQLEQHVASLTLAKSIYQRNITLTERGVVAKATFEGIQSTYEQAQAQINLDQAVIEQRRAELATAELNLSYTRIESPLDGMVLEAKVAAGETVTATQQTPILFLLASDLSRMQAVVRVGELDVGELKAGNPASVAVKAFPGRKFKGTIAQIRNVPETSPQGVSYEMLVNVDNADLVLRPGMSTQVEIETQPK